MGALANEWEKVQRLRRNTPPSGPAAKARVSGVLGKAVDDLKKVYLSNRADWDVDDEKAADEIERNGGIDRV